MNFKNTILYAHGGSILIYYNKFVRAPLCLTTIAIIYIQCSKLKPFTCSNIKAIWLPRLHILSGI